MENFELRSLRTVLNLLFYFLIFQSVEYSVTVISLCNSFFVGHFLSSKQLETTIPDSQSYLLAVEPSVQIDRSNFPPIDCNCFICQMSSKKRSLFSNWCYIKSQFALKFSTQHERKLMKIGKFYGIISLRFFKFFVNFFLEFVDFAIDF